MGCSYCGPRGMVCLGKCSQPLQPWTVFSDEDAGIAELFELAKDVPATAQEATPTIQQLELSSDEQAPPFWPTVTMKRDPDRLGLFDLPPELRTQIYSYISQHIQSLYDDEGRDRLTDDLLRVSTCWTQDRFVALMKRNARFVKMQLVSRQVREEILGTWAEEVVHYGRLRFDIWQEQCRWDFRSLQQLPYAIWSATREVLEKLNDRFGVARYVRHVKLVARFEAKSHGEGPAELLARFDSNGIARQLDHFDAAFAHPDLVVELAVVCTHGQDGMVAHQCRSHSDARQTRVRRAKRTMAFTTNPLAKAKNGRHFGDEWVVCAGRERFEVRTVQNSVSGTLSTVEWKAVAEGERIGVW